MSVENLESVKSLATDLGVSPTTIYRWIADNKLTVVQTANRVSIPYDLNREFIFEKLRQKWSEPSGAWVPDELLDYDEWHQILDYFCWLLKVSYSSPKEIKSRKFRLDVLFANYLRFNKVSLSRLRNSFTTSKINRRLVIGDLKRGWYNEFSYVCPIRPSTLGLSFSDISDNMQSSKIRFMFPSWKIVPAYYAYYFYLRGITLLKQPSFRLQEHGATISAFKNNLLSPLEKVVWKFPFDISFKPGRRISRNSLLISKLPHLRTKYSVHPRPPNLNALGLFEYIYQAFRRRSRRRPKPLWYTLFDFFHDFRVWANYLDIDNLLSLWGGGYKAFLDQNLATVVFFVGGFSELCLIAKLGEKEYLAQLQSLYDGFATNVATLEEEFVRSPIFQRLEIYNQMGLVQGTISLRSHPNRHAIVANL